MSILKSNKRSALAFALLWLVADFACVNWGTGYQVRTGVGIGFLVLAAQFSPALRPISSSDLRRDFRVLKKVVLWAGLAELVFAVGLAVWIFALGHEVQVDGVATYGQVWQYWFLALIMAPFVEELLFRGFFQRQLEVAWGRGMAIFLSGPVFWVYHWIGFGGVSPINHLAAGWILAWAYSKTGSLWVAIALHALGNLSVFVLHSILVAVS